MTVPENNVNHVRDDQEDQRSKLSSLDDGMKEIQQSSVHSPAKDAKTSLLQ